MSLPTEGANLFHFRYIDLAMTRDDGREKTPFTLKKLEAIGRIAPRGLDIEVSNNVFYPTCFIGFQQIEFPLWMGLSDWLTSH